MIDAIAASSLHIRLDSYSASPRRKGQGGAIQVRFHSLGEKCGLDRRIGTRGEWRSAVAAWEGLRNERGVVIRWQFTTDDARIKLRRLYPTLQ